MQVTDPVCGMQIDSTKAAASEKYQGQTYYFCSASCHEKFKAAPDRYGNKAAERSSKTHGGHGCC